MLRAMLAAGLALSLGACAPLAVQQRSQPPAAFSGPYLTEDRFVSFDGAALGMTKWETAEEPWAVIVGLHGMNDYANAFHLAAPAWAQQGIATYAYDQRGFGRSPGRGVWAGEGLMAEDVRAFTALVRARHPNALIAVVGESMGGAAAIAAFASDRPPAADRLVLLAPAVWGWSNQPLPNKTLLWFAARLTGSRVYSPPGWLTRKVQASDNREELIAMGRDRLMIWGARSDALYGLVSLMERAWREVGAVKAPTLYLYGARDQIIPKTPTWQAASRLPAGARTAYYAQGHHLLLRDRQRQAVFDDVTAFLRDPAAALPSGAPGVVEALNTPEARRMAGL